MSDVRVRLLKVVPTLRCGGTEHQVMALGRRIDPDRFALEFACLRRQGDFVAELDARRVPLREYHIRTFFSVNAVAQQARLAADVRRSGVAIVHAYSFYGNVFAIPAAKLAAAPVVIASIRDRGVYLTPAQQAVQRHVCRLADCVLVNAEAVRTFLIDQGYNASKIVVIRNGVDLERFSDQPDAGAVRREFGIPVSAPLVAVASRLHPLKGIEHFLEAASAIGRRFPEVRFLVIGETSPDDRPYFDVLKNLAARVGIRDRVIFTGLRGDVPRLLACAAVSVMPSLNEALSNVLLESMAAGVPVVATRVGGTPEAVQDGVTGLLVPPGDAGALARSIDRLLSDPESAKRLGQSGRQLVRRHFSIDAMVRATEHLYHTLLEKRRRAPIGVATGVPNT
jgi:glycosyltransferase involved in cell wall biosynthesis